MTPLKMERERRGWTATQVADALDVTQSHYSKVENGKAAASPEFAARIAQHFGHSITEMQILYPERYAPQIQKAS